MPRDDQSAYRFSPKRIERVETVLDSSARTALVHTDAGAAYVKAMGNPKEGPHILACELVGTRAAEWLGLPTLDYGMLDLTSDDAVAYDEPDAPSPGPAFVSRAIPAHTWGGWPEELESVVNPEVMAGLVVLDTWILNRDRFSVRGGETICNVRNVLLTSEGAPRRRNRMIAMDHTHCFTYGRELSVKKLRAIDLVKCPEVFGLFEGFKPYVTRERAEPFVARLRSFDQTAARLVTEGIPRLWGWTPEVGVAVCELLVIRAQFLGDNLLEMLETACRWDVV